MRRFLFVLLLGIVVNVNGQIPQVPDVLDFGGMKLHLNEAARKQIQADVDNLRRNESYFRRRMEIVDAHFPIIEKIFREENLPDDFKYLVIQESALVSDAVSTSNAVGFWQFKKETALEMNLRVDNEVDERLNLASSSRAAARYLKKNNFYYDNWIYALLAYNTGRGGAEKYVKEKDFGKNKMEINGNTHWYVKKFLAHKIAYETELGKSSGPFFLFEYMAGGGMTLKDISQEFETDVNLLEEYNKCFKRKKVPEDKTYSVLIPIGFDKTELIARKTEEIIKNKEGDTRSSSSIFSVNKSGSPVKKYYSEADHFPVIKNTENEGLYVINGKSGIIAKPGDNFDLLALRGGVAVEKFLKFNDLTRYDKSKPGQVYYYEKKNAKAKTHYHTLMPGQTLWEVSQKYGLKLNKLLAKNRLKSESEAKAGLVLWLRYIRPKNQPPEYHDIRHFEAPEKPVAEKKEARPTLPPPQEKPAKSYLVGNGENKQVEDAFANDVSTSTEIKEAVKPQPSEVEKLTEARPVISDKPMLRGNGAGTRHEVKKGDTFFSISRLYSIDVSDLLEWNNLKINDVLSIGQQLVIKATPNTTAESRKAPEEVSATEMIIHTVTENDTLYGIAKKYQVTIKDIMEWNAKEDFVIKSGEELKIFNK